MNERGYKENIAEDNFLPIIRFVVLALAKNFRFDSFRVCSQDPGLCMFGCSVYSVCCMVDNCFNKKETNEQTQLTKSFITLRSDVQYDLRTAASTKLFMSMNISSRNW